MKKLLLFFLSFFLTSSLFAQEPVIISGADFVDSLLLHRNDYQYILQDVEVKYNEKEIAAHLDTILDQPLSKDNRFEINARLMLVRVRFYSRKPIVFAPTYFKGGLALDHCVFTERFKLHGCKFNVLALLENKFQGYVDLNDCEIDEACIIRGNNFGEMSLHFNDCKFYDDLAGIDVLQDTFPDAFLAVITDNQNLLGIDFRNTEFDAKYPQQNKLQITGEMRHMLFFQTTFNVPVDFEGTYVKNAFSLDKTEFKHSIGIENFYFPEQNTNANWNMLKGRKLGLFDDSSKPYKANGDKELSYTYNYNELMSAYNRFYTLYKTRGDIESANACYVEMKDIETRKLAYEYRQNKSLKTWLDWKLNVFLKFFCDYGTNPVKSIIFSLWVILWFSLFYFFFYSDWDRINRKFLIGKSNLLLSYFQSEQRLEDFYSEAYKEEIATYEKFKADLKESKQGVPFFFRLFMRPLYFLSVIKYRWTKWLYRRMEFLKGRWVDLSGFKKVMVGIFSFFTVVGYGSYLVLIRSINSLVLSINAFTTLGFGEIPVKGISRYMAILQGFIGWFLLSIFSVSLISQILQN